MRRQTFLWLAALILLVAALLRLVALETLPPGPHYDEAVNVILTRNVAFGGALNYYFPIVPNYQGREVLYYVLAAPLVALVQDGVLALRLTSALLNLLTVGLTIALGRAMFPGKRGVVIALTAGTMLALSFPQIWLARQAFRAVTLPFTQALALVLLWRGLTARRRAWAWLLAAGIAAGAVLYTYMAARLFPVWLLLGGIALLLMDRGQRMKRLRQGALFFGALALTALPIGLFALENPDMFLNRLVEVTTHGAPGVDVGQSILLHLKMFFIAGDPLQRYNVPGRPYFTLPEGLLLLVGLAAILRRLRRREGAPTERAAACLALLSPLMVIPGVISTAGLPPNHMRALGMVPLIFVLGGIGFEAVWAWLGERLPRLAEPRVLVGLTAAAVLIGGVLVGSVYFDWARQPSLFYQTDADTDLAARWLRDHAQPDDLIAFASQHYDHPTVLVEAPPPLIWLKAGTLLWPPPARAGLLVFPRSAPPDPRFAAWLAPYALADLPQGPDGQPAFAAFRIPPGTPPPADLPAPSADVRSQFLRLIGLDAPPVAAGDSGAILTAWRVVAPLPAPDVWPILQVEDPGGDILDRTETELIQTDQWPLGAILFQALPVSVPPGTPPGDHPLRLAWVARQTDTYLPFLNRQGNPGIAFAAMGPLPVTRPDSFPSPEVLSIATPAAITVAPGVQLLGWNAQQELSVRPGDQVGATLFWQAVPAAGERAAITVEAVLVDPGGGERVLWQGAPVRDSYPSDQWADGELVTDIARWRLPLDLLPGPYTLAIRVGEQRFDLTQLGVAAVERTFEPPDFAIAQDMRLGDHLWLVGSTLVVDGRSPRAILVWQADAPIAQDYTVFIHVLDANGMTVAQIDRMPRDNTFPISLWAPGEYVTDEYAFPALPPGTYYVRTGLYLQSDGERLPVTRPDGASDEDFVWLGAITIE